MDKRALMDLHVLVEHVGPFHAGDHVFREGDPFEAIAAVRAGTVKTYVVDRDGHEHVLGFHLPGEVIGLNAIDGETYPCNAVALDTVMLCRFSFPKIAVLATRLPGLQQQLFRLLSRDIGRAALLAGDWTADQRMAAFLIGLSRRLAARGFSPNRFQLTMARTDIANYLRLAPETVSRVLRRFQDGWPAARRPPRTRAARPRASSRRWPRRSCATERSVAPSTMAIQSAFARRDLTWIRATSCAESSMRPIIGRIVMSNTRKLWLGLAALLVASFAVLLWVGGEIFRTAPPMPERVVARKRRSGLHARRHRAAAARSGSRWAACSWARSGATARYVAPDWSADWLHREADGRARPVGARRRRHGDLRAACRPNSRPRCAAACSDDAPQHLRPGDAARSR